MICQLDELVVYMYLIKPVLGIRIAGKRHKKAAAKALESGCSRIAVSEGDIVVGSSPSDGGVVGAVLSAEEKEEAEKQRKLEKARKVKKVFLLI